MSCLRWRARLPVGRPRGGMKSETEHGSWNTWRTYSNNGERWLSSVSTASPRHQHRWATDAMRTGRGGAGSHAADGSTDHRVADRGRYVNILLRCGRSAERKGTACRATCHTASSHLVVHVSDCNHESRTRNGGSAQARGHQRERAPSWNLSGSFLVTFLDPVGSKAHFPTERLGRRRRKCLHQRRRRLRQVKHRIRHAACRPKLAFVVAVGVV